MSCPYTYREEEMQSIDFYQPIYTEGAQIFTQEELFGFGPVHESIYGLEQLQTSWPQSAIPKPSQYAAFEPEYLDYSQPEQAYGGYQDSNPVYMSNGTDFYSSDCFAGSCQASPIHSTAAPFGAVPNTFMGFSHPVSPVTPSGSPNQFNVAAPTAQAAYLLVPTTSADGQFQQYNAFQVPMEQVAVSPENYLGHLTVPSTHPAFEALNQEEKVEDMEEEKDEECILPDHGNKELRGMGLYDDTPDLMYDDASCTPDSCSPITPHNQIRPTLGKGLVLERSFLPEEMMMKDEASGKIVKGRLDMEEDY